MKLSFHHQVQKEINVAAAWYEDHNPGLGETFAKAVMATLEVIQKKTRRFRLFSWFKNGLSVKIEAVPLRRAL